MKRRFSIALPFLLTLAGATTAFSLEPIAVLKPSDVPEGFWNGFGWSVSMSGDYIAVGAPFDPWYNGDWLGAVYVFRRVGPRWIEQAKLIASDPADQGLLGASVAMDGDTLVAGAPRSEFTPCDARHQGTVWVFRRDDMGTPHQPTDDTWFEEGSIIAPDALQGVGLGAAVAIAGDVLVAGSDCGESAEVFRRSQAKWMHEASLRAAVPDDYLFGAAVDIQGERIVVGAYYGGAAYVFAKVACTWQQEARLVPSGRSGFFGWSVSLSGCRVAIGAPGAGRSHVFKRIAPAMWVEEAVFRPSDIPVGDFGNRVAIERGCMVGMGAWSSPAGYAFRYDGSGWDETDKLFGPDDGGDIALQGPYLAVGPLLYVVRGRRDLLDYSSFQNCLSAGCITRLSPVCRSFDLSNDGHLDLRDFGEIMAIFGGP